MKRIISLLLFFSMLLPFSFSLTACNTDGDGGTEDKTVRITDAYKIVYNSQNLREMNAAEVFFEDFFDKCGVSLDMEAYTGGEFDYEIQIGTLKTRSEYISKKSTLERHATSGIGVCVISSDKNRLSVFSSTPTALSLGTAELLKLIDSEGKYEAGLDKLIIFDLRKYERTGEVVGYTLEDLSSFSSATSISVNNKPLTDFSPEVLEYSYEIAYKDSYPTVSVTPLTNSAKVSYEQASDSNGGIATVTVTSGNTESVTVYKIKINTNYYRTLDAQIVNRGGASGAVSFVIDDGNQPTATFAKSMLQKYERLKLGFAIKGNSVASLNTKNTDGATEYEMKDGKYTYTVNQANLNFWLDIKATGKAEILNHTFTHAFHGTNDDGGVFEYVKNGEDKVTTSSSFPKGSSTKEILATKQVLFELGLSDSPLTLIHAGIGVRTQDYTVLGQKIITYKTYLNKVLSEAIERGEIIGSRGTFTVTDDSQLESKIITPKTAYERRLSGVPAFMIEDYTDDTIVGAAYKSDINSWKTHINNAIAKGGLACFCIHNISDTQKGLHHIDKSQAEELFKYADGLLSLAIMNFTEAMKYYHEWNQATVTATAYKDEYITVSVTDTLDNSVYDEALTVKVYLPEFFGDEAKLACGTNELPLRVSSDANGRFVLVDTVPDSGDLKIVSVK